MKTVEVDFNSSGIVESGVVESIDQLDYYEGELVILVGNDLQALGKIVLHSKATFDKKDWWAAKIVYWLNPALINLLKAAEDAINRGIDYSTEEMFGIYPMGLFDALAELQNAMLLLDSFEDKFVS